MAAIEETVGIRRSLAEANPAAYLPAMATSINNLSLRLADADRLAEAVVSRNEAAEAYAERRRQAGVRDQA